jgi:hypothetical protein
LRARAREREEERRERRREGLGERKTLFLVQKARLDASIKHVLLSGK